MTSQDPAIPLKEVPKKASRGDIYRWYNNLATRLVRQVITEAIKSENEKRSVTIPFRTYNFNANHIKFIFTELGSPPGFKNIEE